MDSKLIEIIKKIGATELLTMTQNEAVGFLSTRYRRTLAKNHIDISKFHVETSKVTLETNTVTVTQSPPALSNLPFTPFKHQWQAFIFFQNRENRRMLLCDEMGLGKTITSLMIAKHEGLPVVVVCPASLKSVWKNESEKLGLECQIFSYEKCPQLIDGEYFAIVDEAHYCQNPKAARTKKVFELFQKATGGLLLTGTPMRNGRPVNMFPLLRMVNHPVASVRREYEIRYCDAKPTQFSKWDTTGASNLLELKDKISDVLLQRKKSDCLDLPDKIYSDIKVTPSISDYNQYVDDFKQLMDEYDARVCCGQISEATSLVMMSALRTLNSHLKVNWLLEYLKEFDEAVGIVLFSPFKTTVTLLADKLGVEPFTGDTPLSKREQIIDGFQHGKVPYFVATTGAGGVGVTLHRSSHLIMIDPPWTPGDYHQATDRIHRIGQRHVCNIYNLRCQEIDDYIYDMMDSKEDVIKASIPTILRKILDG